MNVLKTHENILSCIKSDMKDLEYLKDKFNKKYTSDITNNLSEKIFLYSNNIPHYYYKLEIHDIIDEINTQLNISIRISFMKNKKDDKKIQELYEKYRGRIHMFNLSMFPLTKNTKCENCRAPANYDFVDNNTKVCILCGNVEKIVKYTIHHDDGDRIKLSMKNIQNRKIHFKDCLIKFLGIEILNDSKLLQFDELIEKIKSNFKNVDNMTRENILLFLKQNKQYEKFNDNITLIYSKITNTQLHELSQNQINDIVNDFEQLSKTYDDMIYNEEIDPKILEDRKSFLNSQYIIYQLFKKHKIKCDKKDFILLKTISKKIYHDIICELLYKKLGWNFTPIF
jgi:hypothetical protein